MSPTSYSGNNTVSYRKKGLFLGFWNQQAKHLINILLTLVAKFILKTSCNTTWGWGKYLGWNLGRLMRLLKRFCNCFEFRRRKAVLNILRFVSLTIKSVRCAKRELNIFAESFHNIWVWYFFICEEFVGIFMHELVKIEDASITGLEKCHQRIIGYSERISKLVAKYRIIVFF